MGQAKTRERALTDQLENTGDPSPPRNVKAILHESFWVYP